MLIQLYYTISSVSDIIELSDVVPDTATKRLPQIGILCKISNYDRTWLHLRENRDTWIFLWNKWVIPLPGVGGGAPVIQFAVSFWSRMSMKSAGTSHTTESWIQSDSDIYYIWNFQNDHTGGVSERLTVVTLTIVPLSNLRSWYFKVYNLPFWRLEIFLQKMLWSFSTTGNFNSMIQFSSDWHYGRFGPLRMTSKVCKRIDIIVRSHSDVVTSHLRGTSVHGLTVSHNDSRFREIRKYQQWVMPRWQLNFTL